MTDLATYEEWLKPGFDRLEHHWDDQQTWEDVRPDFLDAVHVVDADLRTPEYRVLALLVEWADEMTDPTECRRILLTESERLAWVQNAYAQWQQEAGEEAAVPATESTETGPQWFDGHGWMRVDPATGQWVPTEPADGAEQTQPTASAATDTVSDDPKATDDQTAKTQYVEGRGWMRWDATANEWKDVAGPDSSTTDEAESRALPELTPEVQLVVDDVVKSEVAPALEAAIAEVEGAENLTPEEIQEALEAALAQLEQES
jgi:hypothetical protein